MRTFHLILLVCLGLCPLVRAEVVDFGSGTIDLPPGVEHHPQQALDSAEGTFVSHDGTPTVGYDIGGYTSTEVPKLKFLFFRHGVTHGYAWFALVARNEPHALFVTFPEGGPAHFRADFTTKAERNKALRLILRYIPKRLPQ